VPRPWSETIEARRREVHDATLDTVDALVAKNGLLSVTMSQIAEQTGIGRATLYKYFPDVEAILTAWHARMVDRHLQRLAGVRDRAGSAQERLAAVLEAFALMTFERPQDSELAPLVHRGEQLVEAQRHLIGLVRDLLIEGAKSGHVRDDVAPEELAKYCLHALLAAGSLPSKAAVRRLVSVILAGLLPAPPA